VGGIRGLLPAETSSLNFFRAYRDAIDNRMHKWSNLQFWVFWVCCRHP
jgi:hypothetical protein